MAAYLGGRFQLVNPDSEHSKKKRDLIANQILESLSFDLILFWLVHIDDDNDQKIRLIHR
jgi:hypothetical protein